MMKVKSVWSLWTGMLLSVGVAFHAGASDVVISMKNTQPTCGLTLNGQSTLNYVLGTMTPGSRMKHKAFAVQVTCPGNGTVKTAITAKPGPGGNAVLQQGDDSVRMQVAGTAGVDGNSPQLWLQTEDGKRVKLTGLESDAFCTKVDTSATMPNVCRLTPVTDIPAQSASGNFGATMLIEVVYPQ
jgi:type 1 fimbria pilin